MGEMHRGGPFDPSKYIGRCSADQTAAGSSREHRAGLVKRRFVSGLGVDEYLSVVRDQFLPSFGVVPVGTILGCFLLGVPPLEAVELIAAGV